MNAVMPQHDEEVTERDNHAAVTCEITLFQNCFSLRRRTPEIFSFQRVETGLKLFQNSEAYCTSRIFSNTFNVAEITVNQFQDSFSG